MRRNRPVTPGTTGLGRAPRALLVVLAVILQTGGGALADQASYTVDRPAALAAEFAAALAARGPAYRPNTQLLDSAGRPRHTNRLILEASPYLLQHAHNPVDWHPWGDAAFDLAKRLDRPVFLSVGYATCHWCHVMEEESFDHEGVASLLNAEFIPVKLDREARPDLDHAYMLATQMLTGRGGWPNSVFLLPDGRPFHAGSYFPRANFLQLLAAVAEAWRDPDRRLALTRQAAGLGESIAAIGTRRSEPRVLGEAVSRTAALAIARAHNAVDGGFSRDMQFPQEVWLLFLLDHWRRYGDRTALDPALRTLRAIIAGGIHDHVGGGFHRYAVDPNWRTPHFEKMLYNQALLSRALVEAHAASGHAGFCRAAERTFDYVARDMTVAAGPAAGAFYAAEDADSLAPSGQREEGWFHVWTPAAVRQALDDGEGEEAIRLLGIDRPPTLECGAVAHLRPEDEPDFGRLDPLLARLQAARELRPRPRRDDKVITEWNGLMIRALAEGGLRLGQPARVAAAATAGQAIRRALWCPERGLGRFHAEGRREGAGQLTDYAGMGLACLALHDSTRAPVWLAWAGELAGQMQRRFADGEGRLRLAEADSPLGPVYDADDSATPSGESAAFEFLARLSLRSEDPAHADRARRLADGLSGAAESHPHTRTGSLVAAGILAGGESETSRSVARGNGTVAAHLAGNVARVEVTLAEGWHVNSHQPHHPDLIPTELVVTRGPQATEVAYPLPVDRDLGFMDEPLSLFESAFTLRAVWPEPPVGPVELRLTLQPCSDRICLPPETHSFRLR